MIDAPKGWEAKQISEVAEVIRGVTYSKSKVLSGPSDAGIPLIRATNIQPGKLDYNDLIWIPRSLVKETQELRQGDLLVATSSGSLSVVGKNARVLEDRTATFGAFCTVIRPKKVDGRFLAFWLESPYVRSLWSEKARGSNINNLKSSDLASTGVPVPPLDVQQRIVETLEDHLSRLDNALDDVDSAKNHAKELVRSKRHEVFSPEQLPQSWEYVPISSVLTPMVGKRLTQRGWSPQCLNHTRTSDVEWGVLKTTAIQFGEYKPEHHKQLPVSLEAKPEIEVAPGDLIMTATGPRNRCGIPCLVQETPARLMMSGKMFRFRTNSSICDSRWLLQFLLSDAGQRQLEIFKVGSSDSSVSIGSQQFENIELPLPPISAQVELLSQLDALTDRAKHFELALESTGTRAGLLRRSLLHAAFTGQLTNEDSND